jgi:hypothetical protein
LLSRTRVTFPTDNDDKELWVVLFELLQAVHKKEKHAINAIALMVLQINMYKSILKDQHMNFMTGCMELINKNKH